MRTERFGRPSRLTRGILYVLGITAAAVPAIGLLKGAESRAGAFSLPLTVLTSASDVSVSASGSELLLRGGARRSDPGAEEMPARVLTVKIPDGYRAAGVRVTNAPAHVLAGAAARVSPRGAATGERPVAELLGEGHVGGERVASVLVRPLSRDPGSGGVVLRDRIELELDLRAAGTRAAPLARLREGPAGRRDRARLQDAVERSAVNAGTADAGSAGSAGVMPRSLAAFRPPDLGLRGGEDHDFQVLNATPYPSMDGSLVEYLIITSAGMRSQFQALADWYTEQGIPAAVRTLNQVEGAHPYGVDLPERIRSYIKDAYTQWGTTYVLLGGDVNVVPVRLIYSSYERGEFIASDLYYGALDGTWDANGNGLFGEHYDPGTGAPGDSVDLYPQVHVGRASVQTPAEAAVFVNKVLSYERSPQVGFQQKALFAAQVLFCSDPCHYPQDILLNGADILNGAAAYVPSSWDTLKLYEWPNQNENFGAIVSALDAGYNLVAFANHGDPFKMSTGDGNYMTIPTVDTLSNNRRFFNLFFLNCNTSEIEAECINERMILNPNGGAVSVVAPTRFDYPDVGYLFLDEFYRQLFQGGVTEVGALQDLMKVPFAGYAYWDPRINWNYTSYILLGDPAMKLWLVNPDTLRATGSGSIAVGDSSYTVTVTAQGSPVTGAMVTVWNSSTGDYGRAYTSPSGVAVVPFMATTTGEVRVTASAEGHIADLDSAAVSGGGGRLHVESLTIDDDMAGYSYGNGDGIIDSGERIELGVNLRNSSAFTVPAGACSLSFAPGATLTADLTVNGVRARGFLFAGRYGAHPASLPCLLGLDGGPAGAPDPRGKPLYTPGGQADTVGNGSGLVNGRAYLWEDSAGWHLRAAGGFTSQTIQGTLTTDGAVRTLTPWHTEPGDTVKQVGTNQASFRFNLGPTDEEDGLDLVVADSTGVAVLSGVDAHAFVPPGGAATVHYVVNFATSMRDGDRRRADLGMGSGGRDEVVLDVSGPAPVLYVEGIDDSTVNGNHNGIPEPGETVRLWPRFKNVGGGTVVGTQAILRRVSGAVVQDSVDLVGDLPAGALVGGTDTFQIAVTALQPTLALEIRDSYGNVWRDTMQLSPPAAPTGLVDQASHPASERTVDLTWTPNAEPDLEGYLVYRASAAAGPYTLASNQIMPRTAIFQDPAVANDSTYYYRVTAVDSAGSESPRSAMLTARCRPDYQPGWPQPMQNAAWAPPALADLDGDGHLEVIVGSLDGKVYVWDANGNLRPGWPRSTGGEIWASPAVANLDADPQLEIVVGSNDGNVYAWKANGTGLLQSSGIFATTNAQVRSTPTFADLDEDGKLEVLAGNSAGRLYAWRANGTPYLNGNPIFAAPSGWAITGSPTVADVDQDGRYEIFFATIGGQVYAYNHDGTPFLGSGALFYTAPGADSSGFWGSMAVGDLDHDGHAELVGTSWNGNVYAWKMDGTLKPGFPRYIAGGALIPYEDGKCYRVWSSPALGDLDGDGKLEIVAGSRDQRVYAVRSDGSIMPGWPYVTGFEVWGGPVLADLDGDGHPEVVVGSLDNAIHAVKANGTRLPGWPIRTGDQIYSSPAVADLDGDGRAEVVVPSYDGYVYVWKLAAPWRAASSPWPTFAHDNNRTGWYDWQYPTQLAVVPPAGAPPGPAIPTRVTLAASSPNPTQSAATLRFGLPAEGEAKLTLYDVSGRRVRELARGPWGAGWHDLAWDGRDDAGAPVAAGVYFYRLETGGERLTRKLIVTR